MSGTNSTGCLRCDHNNWCQVHLRHIWSVPARYYGCVLSFFTNMAVLELMDLGVASNFMGIRVQYDELNGYKSDQEVAIMEVLIKFELDNSNPVRELIGG
ncbi:uncharacterized protein PHALS_07813 [Plasmopara halstedii]|uniref:Uncharacterized protein n=1 Tax=Plasmopara halstedii TaxID=4781 RepID=A0A0P1B715_PLAHL|nr:uncharacterized protein PHALS_07813 [Plasmopara halstedii]CEG50086.1 hypothetical protein PHALS_07813 [Plasmopara halstedii]|eukprot:XP_024586455.1 hypothetical protein PHALS_07813 [Plasmopara halstedii]